MIVQEFMTLDAVVQAPGGREEDTTGGFAHGGWHMPYMEDDRAREWVLGAITGAGGYLLGRRTYEIFAGYWPTASEEERVIAEPLNTKPKYVASTTLTEPLPWQPSTVLGNVPEGVGALKREDGGDLLVIGSSQLVQALLDQDLVDELLVMIDPLVVGGGKRIFREDGTARRFRLVDGEVTSTGAFLGTYAPAEPGSA